MRIVGAESELFQVRVGQNKDALCSLLINMHMHGVVKEVNKQNEREIERIDRLERERGMTRIRELRKNTISKKIDKCID